jgi:uncharacterized membrane protein YccC
VIEPLLSLPRDVLAELREMTLRGPRAILAIAAALAVAVAIVLALALHLQDVYWAGISAFVCMQASQPASLQKGLHRILGTVLGAAAALICFSPIAFDHVATMLLLFCAGALAIAGSLVSRHSYAWLLGGITAVMVVLGALDEPDRALNIAFYRSTEIVLGTSVALVISRSFLPAGTTTVPTAPGWGSLFETRNAVLDHAFKAGLAVALVPPVWRIFALPNLSQMAISIGAVMAVPVLTASHEENRRAVIDRSVQRLVGCLVGGGLGLLVLTWSASLPLWLLVLMMGAAVGIQLETGRRDVKTFAIQAEVALILTLVQGWGPARSLLPAIERVFGMVGALLLLLAVSLILGSPRRAEPRTSLTAGQTADGS